MLLVLSYALSHLSHFYWAFELFSNFLIQYAIAGVVLFGISFLFGFRRLAFVAIILSLATYGQARFALDKPFVFSELNLAAHAPKSPKINLVQFNHSFRLQNLGPIEVWLKDNADEFDVVVLQEASMQTKFMASRLSDFYPYQLNQHRNHTFGMVVLSKHEILEYDLVETPNALLENFLLRFSVLVEGLDEPLKVYALHAVPPLGKALAEQRNFEIGRAANLVGDDKSPYLVFMGDFNLTPYSPVFSSLIKTSGLKYQSFGLFLNPSWPSFGMFDFLKISIDHVLTGGELSTLKKMVGPSFGSDHNALVTNVGILDE